MTAERILLREAHDLLCQALLRLALLQQEIGLHTRFGARIAEFNRLYRELGLDTAESNQARRRRV